MIFVLVVLGGLLTGILFLVMVEDDVSGISYGIVQ